MASHLGLFISLMSWLLPAFCWAQQPVAGSLPPLPKPFETIQDAKQFNAVSLGPGNSISFVQTPPDFQLNQFAIAADGSLLAMGWASGRIELWDLRSKKKVSEFKSSLGSPGTLQFDSQGKQLIVTGSGGRIAFLDVPTGKRSKGWTIPLGKYKYDIQQVVVDPKGKWLAYADEEASKVLDVTTDPPTMIADLRDAGSVALSQDGTELWTVNRAELKGFNSATWEMIGHRQLKSPPVNTSPTLVRTGLTRTGERTVAVPSGKGLVVYRGSDMDGEFVTDRPTSAVGFARRGNVYVNLAQEITFLDLAGTVCKKSYKGRVGYDISEDGQWLALSQFSTVDLWRMEDLLRDCDGRP
jgi:hypothetical protein